MTTAAIALQNKFGEILRWERQKRRERMVLRALVLALAAAVLLSPLHLLLPFDGLRWLVPVILLVGIAPVLLFSQRWHNGDTARTLVELDRELGSAERAVTAWELAERGDASAAAQWVFQQAEPHLRDLEPRRFFPRRWDWSAYMVAPLLLFWFLLLWFNFDRSFSQQPVLPTPSLAQQLREFARDLQEKARTEGLRKSLQLGQELAKVAERNLAEKTNDEQLKKDLAGVKQRLDANDKSGPQQQDIAGAEGNQSLKDLQAELEAARDMMAVPDGAKAIAEQQWLERLASMPQLRKQLDHQPRGGQGMGRQELQSVLDRLDRQVADALDRRALIDAQQYLEQMMNQGQGKESNNSAQKAGQGEEDQPGDGIRERNPSNLPGKEPGTNDDSLTSLPQFRAETRSQVKGQLRDGESSGVVFKGMPTPGKSELARQELVAEYRRQAEQELNSEKVPAALKATVRKYFLSLDENKK